MSDIKDFVIKDGVLERCFSNEAEIVIPDGVTSIGYGAFQSRYSLTSITIPRGVTSIGIDVFWDCRSLTSICVAEGHPKYYSESNCVIEKETQKLVLGCKTSIIPDSVTTIGKGAFSGCKSLTSITIPNSVTSIDEFAFSSCANLTNITIPNSVTSIGLQAFYACENLTSITIPDSVTSIGFHSFDRCSRLVSITIPANVTSIGEGAFVACNNLTSICVAEGNPKYYSKNNCLIEKETKELLLGCKTSIIPDDVVGIAKIAFSYSNITEIVIPNSITSIGEWAFGGCSSLKNITIPNSVTTIDNYAFQFCWNLTSITFPDSVKILRKTAFKDCNAIKDINISHQTDQRIETKAYRLVWDAFVKTKNKMSLMLSFLKYCFDIVKSKEYYKKTYEENKNKLFNYAVEEDNVEVIEKLFSLYDKVSLEDLDIYLKQSKKNPIINSYILKYKSEHYSAEKQ